ncbi:MAG TPA: hypothetical protein VF310_00570 [Vicinamibacteria bacterium]
MRDEGSLRQLGVLAQQPSPTRAVRVTVIGDWDVWAGAEWAARPAAATPALPDAVAAPFDAPFHEGAQDAAGVLRE